MRMTRSSKKPAFQAAAAFLWLASAISSCSMRLMDHLLGVLAHRLAG
jgi:hypothetical protein